MSRIVILDMKGLRDFSDPHCVSLTEFAKADADYDWAEAAREVSGDQPAMILFGRHDPIASGGHESTASGGHDIASIGQVLRQSDLMSMLAMIRGRLGLMPRDERLALLGMADPVERLWGLYAALDSGCISNYLESPNTEFENLRELQPTVLGADAEVWTHLYAHTTQAAEGATVVQKHLYRWAIRSGRRGGLQGWVADLLVLGAVRRELGLRRLRLAYMGGEGVSPAVLDWAQSLGVRLQRIESSGAAASASDTQAGRIMRKAPA